jgi:hypothetical protein
LGGYTLNSNDGCDVATVQTTVTVATANFMLKTLYVDSTTLTHYLYAVGMSFIKADVNWSANVKLSMVANSGVQTALTLTSAEWPSNNDYSLIFNTNNPISSDLSVNSMPFTRRLLQSTVDLSNYKTEVEIS